MIAFLLAHRSTVALAALCAALAASIGSCRHERAAARAAASEARSANEREQLRLKEQIVGERQTSKALGKTIAGLTAGSPAFACAVSAAQKAAPGAKPLAVVTASTGPLTVGGGLRPTPTVPGNGAPASPPGAPSAGCVLAQGDHAEARVRGLTLRTDTGNDIVAGTISCYRLDPGDPTALPITLGGDELLFEGPFSAPVSRLVERIPAAPSVTRARWALRAGAQWTAAALAPTGLYAGGDLRVLGPLWLTTDIAVDSQSAARLGARWEW